MKTLVLRDETQPGFPNHGAASTSAIYQPSLEDALEERYDYDAHTTQYSAPSILRRLDTGMLSATKADLHQRIMNMEESYALKRHKPSPSKEHIESLTDIRWPLVENANIQMFYIMFDIDGPKDKHTKECSPEYRQTIREGVNNLFSEHPGLAYMTRGGARIVYKLPDPMPMRTREHAALWTAMYLSYARYISRWMHIPTIQGTDNYGIDLSCKDWPRNFRLPRTRRYTLNAAKQKVPNKHIENRGMMGSLDEPFVPSRDELDRLMVLPNLRTYNDLSSDTGIFIEMLKAWGMLGDKKGNFYFCQCPLWEKHTTGTDGRESSCAVHGAKDGGTWGTIDCFHKSHEHLTGARDWINACKWNDEDFKVSTTWRNMNTPDTNDSWGEHEDKKSE